MCGGIPRLRCMRCSSGSSAGWSGRGLRRASSLRPSHAMRSGGWKRLWLRYAIWLGALRALHSDAHPRSFRAEVKARTLALFDCENFKLGGHSISFATNQQNGHIGNEMATQREFSLGQRSEPSVERG